MAYRTPSFYLDAACTQPVGMTDSQGLATIGSTLAVSALDTAQQLWLACPAGYRTPSAVTVSPTKSLVASDYDSDATVCATQGGTFVASGLNVGVVGDTSNPTAIWYKEATGKTSTPLRNVYLYAAFGGDLVALPSITAGPSLASTLPTSLTITASHNSTTMAMKYLVLAANATAPTTSDWAGVSPSSSLLAGSVTVTGLTGATSYDVYAWASDGTFATVSAKVVGTTLTAGGATSFTSQPAASSITTTDFTLTWNVANALVSWKISYDSGATFATITPAGSGPYTYAVTGKSPGTTYDVVIRNYAGTTIVDSNTVSVSTSHALGDDSNAALIFADPFTGTSGHPSSTNWAMQWDDAGTGDNGTAGDFQLDGTTANCGARYTLATNRLHFSLGTVPPGGARNYLHCLGVPSSTQDQVVEWQRGNLGTTAMLQHMHVRGTVASRGVGGITVVDFSGYLLNIEPDGASIYKCKSDGTYAIMGSKQSFTPAADDVFRLCATGSSTTTIKAYRNGTQICGTQTDSTSPLTTGRPGIWYNSAGWASSSSHDIYYVDVYKATNVQVTGLSAGMYIRLTDGTHNADAAWSSGTLTVELAAVACGESGCSVQLYQGNPTSGGTLLHTKTGIYGGAILAVS
ncbi:MAG: hypothetical protein WCN81_00070 [Actinomycetes bacterium]